MPIREMTEEDIPQVLAIQDALAFQDWSERDILNEINASYSWAVVYEDFLEGEPVIMGYAIFHLMGSDSELLSIAVRKGRMKRGIGRELLLSGLEQLEVDGDRCFLEVREGNTNARGFYEHNGFVQYSTRSNYYSDGEDACLYCFPPLD